MALSGSFYKNVGSHWRLSIEWTATQDIANNQSDITAKMYWEALDSYGAVNSSATKTSAIQHDDGTFSTESSSGMADLSGNQKKLINTYAFTVTHDSDGTKTFSLDGYFDAELTLGGTYYGRIDLDQHSFTLNTIPRASSLTSGATWTAGGSLAISVSRASSSFTHDLAIYVNEVLIQTVTGIGTSTTWNPSTADQESIFKELAKDTTNWDQPTRLVLTTKSGGSTIGSKTYTGEVNSPTASTVSVSDFNIGSTPTIKITEKDSEFVHTITAKVGSYTPPTIATKTTSLSVDWDTSGIASSIYAQTPNSNSILVTFTCTTYYGSTVVRKATTDTAYAKVVNSNPTFGTGYTYKDINTAVTAITGTSTPVIVQGISNLQVDLPTTANAVGVNGATITSYVATVNGVSATKNYSASATVSFPIGSVNASGNVTLSVKAIDSRGNSTTTTKTISVVAYVSPVATVTALRDNGFDANTVIKVSGSFSSVNGLNGLKSYTWNYKLSTDSAYPTTELTFATATVNGTTYTIPDKAQSLDQTLTYKVRVLITDKFNTVTTVEKTVSSGTPIMFIDATKKSIGVNKFPTANNELQVAGYTRTAGLTVTDGYLEVDSYNDTTYGTGKMQSYYDGVNKTWILQSKDVANNVVPLVLNAKGKIVTNAGQYVTDGDYGLDLQNSDIRGANGVYFSLDTSQANNGEGLMFLKSGKTVNSPNVADYDNIYALDGIPYFNGNTILNEGDIQIQTGYANVTPVANTPTALSITFPKAFSGVPRVFVNANSTVIGTKVTGVSGTGSTTTGFTIYVTRTDTTSTGVYWTAIYGGSR